MSHLSNQHIHHSTAESVCVCAPGGARMPLGFFSSTFALEKPKMETLLFLLIALSSVSKIE